jgi:hypothetical protein
MKAMLFLLAGVLTACQSAQAPTPGRQPPPHRGAVSGAGSGGAMGSGTAAGEGQGMRGVGKQSWYGLCELSQRIADAPTPAARQALVEQAMPNMSQESREQHLQMMREHCR